MGRKVLIALVAVLSLVLAVALTLLGLAELVLTPPVSTEATTTAPASTEATTVPTETETVETTAAAEVTEPATEPQPEYFTLTFVGDCTLGSMPASMNNWGSFIQDVGDDYAYPFRNVSQYFSADDCTFANLESVFADEGTASDKMFTFRAPVSFAQILPMGSVEAVTLANNHTYDFGAAGYRSTKAALDQQGVRYAEQDGSVLITTESGLTIGMYAISFYMDQTDLAAEIDAMRQQGAEIIVVALHCGDEGVYTPTEKQMNYSRLCIDLGADIVWGHHPHVLQPIEEYGNGIIYYSLGNFSFGGNTNPRDKDSAVLQQQIIREPDGTVRLGELTIIPCSISSVSSRNNYQPTPYEPGSAEYDRALRKLSGTFTGPDIIPGYNKNPEPTETTGPESTSDTQPETGTEAPVLP